MVGGGVMVILHISGSPRGPAFFASIFASVSCPTSISHKPLKKIIKSKNLTKPVTPEPRTPQSIAATAISSYSIQSAAALLTLSGGRAFQTSSSAFFTKALSRRGRSSACDKYRPRRPLGLCQAVFFFSMGNKAFDEVAVGGGV